jgi:glycosyltransferase involved in cell wall biosynthesis
MKEEKTLLSICCNTHNHQDYIREAIEGFLMQKTTFPIEIIIHDDASTDNTAKIIKEYADKHSGLIFPVLQKENQYLQGVNIAATFMYPRARGKYIARCDGDDYWTDPCKLQKQVDFLEENKEYVLSYHNVDLVDKDKNLIFKNNGHKEDFGKIDLMKGPMFPMSSLCFRNLIKGMPFEGYRMDSSDRLLISRLGRFGKAKWMGDKIKPAAYRKHSQGVWSGKKDIEKFFLYMNSTFWLYQYYKRTGPKEVEIHFLKEFTRKMSPGFYLRHPGKALCRFVSKK